MALLKSNTIIYGTANIQSVLTVGAVTPNNSISNTTGSLIVYGGVGITGNLYANTVTFGDGTIMTTAANISAAFTQANSASANTIYLTGALNTQNANISAAFALANATAGGLVTANANTVLLFGYVNSANANIIAIRAYANTLLPNTGSLITVNGASQLYVSNTTTSVSNGTGALIVYGGAGITGNVYANSVYANGLFYAANNLPWVMGGGGGSSSVALGAVITTAQGWNLP
jgi:hypothetical protein